MNMFVVECTEKECVLWKEHLSALPLVVCVMVLIRLDLHCFTDERNENPINEVAIYSASYKEKV